MVANSQSEYKPKMTVAEYLEFERTSDLRHEFVNGEIIAMTGGSDRHHAITMNLSIKLGGHALDKGCRAYSENMRLQVSEQGNFRYPDFMVVCGELHFIDNRTDTIDNPTLLIEIPSPSSEITDRNQKLAEYLQLDTVKEYLLITQTAPKIERFLRQSANDWLYTAVIGLENSITLPSIDYTLQLRDVYRNVAFEINE